MRTEPTYICEYCGKRFTTIEPCRKHERTHINTLKLNIQIWDDSFNLIPISLDTLRNAKKSSTAICIRDEESKKVWSEINGKGSFQIDHLMYYDEEGALTEDGYEWIDLTDRYNELESELSFINNIFDKTINKVVDK